MGMQENRMCFSTVRDDGVFMICHRRLLILGILNKLINRLLFLLLT